MKQKRLLRQISLNSWRERNKRLAQNVFEGNFDRWVRKRISADALSWYQSSKSGSSIIDYHSEKFFCHENNEFLNFLI